VTRAIAVLRPEPGNAATVARVMAAGRRAIALPLFVVRPLTWTAPDPADFDGILFTSANAVRHGGKELTRLKGLPAFAVGENSAQAARAAGFDVKASGARDAAAIIAQARASGHARLLHLGGQERAIDIEGAIAVYASEPVPIGTADLTGLTGSVTMLHSVRAAQRLAELLDSAEMARDLLALVAISPAVARAAGTGWRAMASAAVPRDDAMIAAAGTLVD
jgi:uroporphyrinogen-III synthase